MRRPWVYLDSSAFAKLFTYESGSQEVRGISRKSRIILSCITGVECISALSRKKAEEGMKEVVFEKIVEMIRTSLAKIDLIRLSDEVLIRAEMVVLVSAVRALDALHLASVLEFQNETGIRLLLVTADRKQEAAAKLHGIRTKLV
ncbi:type II toxin-antitoxin system VapC family toxin [bacterium]|nr:type II toxin-antitoxin system VapC family toxin [bacterium]MCI0603465.1 type II toxin-antitoxin system VapC family toxin [bacterium]